MDITLSAWGRSLPFSVAHVNSKTGELEAVFVDDGTVFEVDLYVELAISSPGLHITQTFKITETASAYNRIYITAKPHTPYGVESESTPMRWQGPRRLLLRCLRGRKCPRSSGPNPSRCGALRQTRRRK